MYTKYTIYKNSEKSIFSGIIMMIIHHLGPLLSSKEGMAEWEEI